MIQEKSKKIQIVLVNSKDENDINVVEKTIKQTADNEENSQDDLPEYKTFSDIVDIDTGTLDAGKYIAVLMMEIEDDFVGKAKERLEEMSA